MKTRAIVENVPITYLYLDVTNNCILSCDYCFRGKKNKQRLSWEIGTKTIDFLIRHSQNQRSLVVGFIGGEPLLEFELIKKLVPYAKLKTAYYGKEINFHVTTNCVLVNDEIIHFFRQHNIRFLTSIDGGPESHDKHRHFPNGSGTLAII
ncbi:MAG: radical SAM protein, partial [bacterium]